MAPIRSQVLLAALLTMLCLTTAACDNVANPDVGQLESMSQSVIRAAKSGDRDKLLDLALEEMEARDAAAAALVTQAESFGSEYSVTFVESHSPDHQVVTATDTNGHSITFKLSWYESKWQLALGKARSPRSPTAKASPS